MFKSGLKVLFFIFVAMVLAFVTTGCSDTSTGSDDIDSNTDADTATSSVEQVITVAQGVDATSMDPPMSTSTTDKNVTSQIFDTLLYRDHNMEVQPHLATSWEVIDDNTWEIDLEKGITFHNGEAFNGYDVKYSIERIIDPDFNAPSRSQFMSIERVDVIEDYKVHIVTKEPYPVLPAVLTELWIVPSEYTEGHGREELARKPVGTGPFKFVEWVRDERIVLAANENYWKGAPKLEQVVFLPIPESGTRIAMLRTGEVDIVAGLPPYTVGQLESNPDVDVVSATGARAYFLGLNTIDDTPIADPMVRTALAHAINVDEIIEGLFDGYGQRLASLLGPSHFGFNPDLQPVPYDPEKAKQLMAEAGYPDGFSIDFDAPNGRYLMDGEVVQVIAGQLREVGIDVNLDIKEWGTFIGAFASDTAEVAPLWYMGWSIPTFDADSILYPLWTPDTYSGYDNKVMTNLLTEARFNMNRDDRLRMYHEALELGRKDMIQVPLFQLEDIYGKRVDVQWEPRSDERILLYDAYKK